MWSSTKRATGKLSKKDPGDGLSERGNRPGIMPFEANAAIPEGGTGTAFWGWIVPVDRHERRGKNGSVRLSGTHKPQYRGLRNPKHEVACGRGQAVDSFRRSSLHVPVYRQVHAGPRPLPGDPTRSSVIRMRDLGRPPLPDCSSLQKAAENTLSGIVRLECCAAPCVA
jgi:hypothetical protein